ncbi:hypothetical protein Daus18300_012478 [Diaporthe australafricana]|uniref:Uncharacterized protein n=1 Tax=Diaporthe australafricana TaxID=127596 RepID=A0ABR3W2K9_9PEZI
MNLRFPHLFAVAAHLVLQSNCMLTQNDIPDKWKSSVSQAWDNAVIRSRDVLNLESYPNWALDQIMDGDGTINVCMRWGANETLTEDDRNQIVAVYEQNYQSWLGFLPGYDNFPYTQVKSRVTGWAVNDESFFQGSSDGFEIYSNFTDEEGFPTCNPGCSRHEHPDGDYSSCDGGAQNRFHQFFLLDPIGFGNFTMAAATGYGFYVGLTGWETVGSKLPDWPLLLHETGHTFGFPDYLDDGSRNHTICFNLWLPPNAPAEFVMKPGDYGAHVHEITEMEGWMTRYWWSRFSRLRGWQHDNTTSSPLPNCTSDN